MENADPFVVLLIVMVVAAVVIFFLAKRGNKGAQKIVEQAESAEARIAAAIKLGLERATATAPVPAVPAPVPAVPLPPWGPSPTPPPAPAPVPAPALTLTDHYVDRDDLMKACGAGFAYAVMLDGAMVHNGFGPADSFVTNSDGSISRGRGEAIMTTPTVPRPERERRRVPAPSVDPWAPAAVYANVAALVNDISTQKGWNTCVMVDGEPVVEGFGPPLRYVTKAGGNVAKE